MTTDLTPLAEDLLISPHFSPRMSGQTTVSILGAQRVDVELDDIGRAMLELTTSGLTKETPPSGEIQEPLFRATSEGLKARELILHRRCIRSRCLRDQQKYPLKDLIVALAMFPIIANRRKTGGFFGTLPEVWERELELHLLLYEAGAVVREAEKVVALGWMAERTLPEGRLFSITPQGEREYLRRIRGELNLGAGETILDEVLPQAISVFYAWQSDHNPSRTHITDALERIEKTANSSWRVYARFAIETATDVGDGAVRIDTALMEKIARADCVVADATPVAVHNGRLLPNPNILIEIGYALASKPPHQVILVEHARRTKELLTEVPAARLPFDIDHVHRLKYDAPAELRARLEGEIRQILVRLGRVR